MRADDYFDFDGRRGEVFSTFFFPFFSCPLLLLLPSFFAALVHQIRCKWGAAIFRIQSRIGTWSFSFFNTHKFHRAHKKKLRLSGSCFLHFLGPSKSLPNSHAIFTPSKNIPPHRRQKDGIPTNRFFFSSRKFVRDDGQNFSKKKTDDTRRIRFSTFSLYTHTVGRGGGGLQSSNQNENDFCLYFLPFCSQ